MIKWIGTSFLVLLVGFQVTASVFGGSEFNQDPDLMGCVDCFNFIAPSVAGTGSVSPAEIGLIVYDSTDGTFQGSTGNGWVNLSGNSIDAAAGSANATLEDSDERYQRFNPTSADISITLGDSYPIGRIVMIKNAGTKLIKVQSDTGTADIAPVYPGATLQFVVNTASPTTAAHWDVIGTITSDWKEFTSVFAGETTNPTKGTIDYDKAFWRRVGDSMEIRFSYRHTTAGTAGSGIYLIKLPSGFTINSSLMANLGGGADRNIVGSGSYGAGENYGIVSAYDSTSLIITGSGPTDSGHDTWASSVSGHSFGDANVRMSLHATVPITGWKNNSGI